MCDQVIDYLAKLLNRPITEESEIFLTSAQRARFHSWLTKNQIGFDEEILSGKFIVQSLILDMPNQSSEGKHDPYQDFISTNDISTINPNAIGVDIQKIGEIFPYGLPLDLKSDPELISIFTFRELSYAQTKNNPLETLTGIFCAKEAIQKCSFFQRKLRDIEIQYKSDGRPVSDDFSVSISHSGEYAIAVAFHSALFTKQNLKTRESFELQDVIESRDNANSQHFRSLDIILLVLILISLVLHLTM
ncbi:4'-phosphopantetheinyl transferase superfamily protein [Polynucleobacter paneuropaeus]|nr:4'-phosphopantetheinyl transferase superfamily protein [Polynucleobacter paneuropaeus]